MTSGQKLSYLDTIRRALTSPEAYRAVVQQERIGDAGKPLFHRLPPRLRHGGDEQTMIRMQAMQGVDQRRDRDYLAERHGMNPDQRAAPV